MLYRSIVPGTAADAVVPFISPVGAVSFDRVDDVSEQVELKQQGGDIELSVPLAVLGMTLQTGETILQGDIGILRGTGTMTTQLLYWNNLNTAINSELLPIKAVAPPATLVPCGRPRLVLHRNQGQHFERHCQCG